MRNIVDYYLKQANWLELYKVESDVRVECKLTMPLWWDMMVRWCTRYAAVFVRESSTIWMVRLGCLSESNFGYGFVTQDCQSILVSLSTYDKSLFQLDGSVDINVATSPIIHAYLANSWPIYLPVSIDLSRMTSIRLLPSLRHCTILHFEFLNEGEELFVSSRSMCDLHDLIILLVTFTTLHFGLIYRHWWLVTTYKGLLWLHIFQVVIYLVYFVTS